MKEITRTKYSVKDWECPDLSESYHPNAKEFKGVYGSGMVNLPDDLFTEEQIAGWVKEGTLTVIE